MMDYYWILVVYSVSTMMVASGWKWRIEAGPNLPSQDENMHGLLDGDSDSISVHNDDKDHPDLNSHLNDNLVQQKMQGDQGLTQLPFGNSKMSSGIQSHSEKNNNDPGLGSTTDQYQVDISDVRSQHNSEELQEVKRITNEDEEERVKIDLTTLGPHASRHNKTSAEAENSVETFTKAATTTNTLGIPPGNVIISQEEPEMLQNLVATLQEQLLEAQTSQVRTR